MSEIIRISPKSQAHWELEILRQEMRILLRERSHLRQKKLERELTPYEQERARAIMTETTAALERFGELQDKTVIQFAGYAANLDKLSGSIS